MNLYCFTLHASHRQRLSSLLTTNPPTHPSYPPNYLPQYPPNNRHLSYNPGPLAQHTTKQYNQPVALNHEPNHSPPREYHEQSETEGSCSLPLGLASEESEEGLRAEG